MPCGETLPAAIHSLRDGFRLVGGQNYDGPGVVQWHATQD